MGKYFDSVNTIFGFGFMRIPEKDDYFDIEQIKQMVDCFMDAGFTYFDTAHGYCNGMSEKVLKETLVDRYPREKYTIADKLSDGHFESESDIIPLFESQLEAVGVDYFDFYLMHAQGKGNFDKYKKCRAYETAFELKAQGRVKHVGISFHDTPEVLDEILTEYPQIEFAQLQFNYLDFENPTVRSRECLDVCRKHNVPVIVMEPVRGGRLADLPEEARGIVESLGSASAASYAVRFCAGFDGVMMVLSGMSSLQMVEDNVSYMKNFVPLSEKELEAIDKINAVFAKMNAIPCTSCNYCTEHCPQNIAIPEIFACSNTKKQHDNWNAQYYYGIKTEGRGKASDCIECGVCEHACPQHIEIRSLLKECKEQFEK